MLEMLRRVTPGPVKAVAKSVILRLGRNLAKPSLVGRGTVQDLYYWVSDGTVDTNVLLNNFYSVFFPHLETSTTGSLTVYDPQGRRIGRSDVSVSHLGCVKLTLSRVLREWSTEGQPLPQHGAILFTLAIPPAVLQAIKGMSGAFYFWHRFYIEYVTPRSQPAFVHCVDKTLIFRQGADRPQRWYPRPRVRDWAPEIPLNIEDYRRLWVILLNRSPRPARVTLTVTDTEDRERTLSASIVPTGVHRFELTREGLTGLTPQALRMRVTGMPTTWGRPVLFKEFHNGTISTMHC